MYTIVIYIYTYNNITYNDDNCNNYYTNVPAILVTHLAKAVVVGATPVCDQAR